jgi:hypothetical protein
MRSEVGFFSLLFSVLDLRSFDLYVSQHRSLTAILGQKKASFHSLVFTEIYVTGTERRAQVRQTHPVQ